MRWGVAVPPEGVILEIHFGKPVVARVRKCRLVVVKNKRSQDEQHIEPLAR